MSSINSALTSTWLVFDSYPAQSQGPFRPVLWEPFWVLGASQLASIPLCLSKFKENEKEYYFTDKSYYQKTIENFTCNMLLWWFCMIKVNNTLTNLYPQFRIWYFHQFTCQKEKWMLFNNTIMFTCKFKYVSSKIKNILTRSSNWTM